MLQKKCIVVSGAAGGIGARIFLNLLEAEAFPIGIDIIPYNTSELKRKIDLRMKSDGEFFIFHQGDASDENRMKELFAAIAKFGAINGLVNNAGFLGNDTAHGGRNIRSFRKMMKAHAETAFVLTELAAPLMKDGGSIVNIGSIELIMAAPDVVLYTAAKGAMHGMTVAYSTTLADQGIRVNMVSPGDVNTERNIAQYQNEKSKKLVSEFRERTPLKRSVEPREVADAVLFLLSEKASAITGQELIVDCGYTRALWDPGWTKIR